MNKAYTNTRKEHSDFDIALTLALTIHQKNYDGRFSDMNKRWADNFLQTNSIDTENFNRFYGCNTHPHLLNGFTDVCRKNIANRSLTQMKGQAEESQEPELVSAQSQGRH